MAPAFPGEGKSRTPPPPGHAPCSATEGKLENVTTASTPAGCTAIVDVRRSVANVVASRTSPFAGHAAAGPARAQRRPFAPNIAALAGTAATLISPRDVIVEFIGLPGAGKSALACALAAELAADVDVELPGRGDYRRKELTRADKWRLDARSPLSLWPYRLARLGHDIRVSGIRPRTVLDSWRLSRYPLVLLEHASRNRRRVLVLDEWLLHRTIDESIRRYGASIAFARKFAIAPTPRHRKVYVCVDIDQRVAHERILEQDQPFRAFARDKDPHLIDEVLAQWQTHLDALKPEIVRRGLPLIEVDGNAPIDGNVALLRLRLRQLLAGEGPAARPSLHPQ